MIEREWLMSKTGARLGSIWVRRRTVLGPKVAGQSWGCLSSSTDVLKLVISPHGRSSFHFVHVFLEIASDKSRAIMRLCRTQSYYASRVTFLGLRPLISPMRLKGMRRRGSQLGPETPTIAAGCAFCNNDQSMLTQILRPVEPGIVVVQSSIEDFSLAETLQR